MPKVDDKLVVDFGGEIIRCPIVKVISNDAVFIKLDSPPMAKSHGFQFNSTYGARRRDIVGRDVWQAQQNADFLAEQRRLVEAAAKAKAEEAAAVRANKKKSTKEKVRPK
jgi:hypothetical protein